MSTTMTASRRIVAEVASWPGVTTAPGRFGARSLMVDRRELGHLHGDRVAHFGFPRRVAAELLTIGRVTPHPYAPDSPGLAERRIAREADIVDVIALMRLNYDRIVAHHGLPGQASTAPA
jgi:hypothetical protein